MATYLNAFDNTSFERVKERMGVETSPEWDTIFSLDLKTFEFVECLGCGAYAEVWLCKTIKDGDFLAVKIEGISPEPGELQGF